VAVAATVAVVAAAVATVAAAAAAAAMAAVIEETANVQSSICSESARFYSRALLIFAFGKRLYAADDAIQH